MSASGFSRPDIASIKLVFADLLAVPRWVVWRAISRNGKWAKVPVTPDRGLPWAKADDSSTWRSFAAVDRVLINDESLAGPGIELGDLGDGRHLIGIDLDLCRSPLSGKIEGWAQEIVNRCPTYVEISPSGTGVKLLGYVSRMPKLVGAEKVIEGACIPEGADTTDHKAPEVGIYVTGRFFTLTGRSLEGSSRNLRDISGPLARIAAKLGLVDAFAARLEALTSRPDIIPLWDRTRPIGDGSASAYDFALASEAVKAGWPDQEIAELIRRAREHHGEVKGERDDYLVRTIRRARTGKSYVAEFDSDEVEDTRRKLKGGKTKPTEERKWVVDDPAPEIARLSALDSITYDREREEAAEKLGCRVATLDREVKKRRGEASGGRALAIETPEPHPEPVAGAELLGDLAATFRRFLHLPSHADTAAALWVIHSYAFEASPVTPRLAITSPEKRCGKTTVLELIAALACKPQMASNITAAATFRLIEMARPTLLVDEADTFLGQHEELRGVLNSGHRSTGAVVRVEERGGELVPATFSTWAPVAIAMIGRLPGTLADRSIELRMTRRAAGEAVERWRCDRIEQFSPLRRRCARWAQDHLDGLREADPEVPASLHDRAADNWRPLLAIADLTGGEWPARARAAAMALSVGGEAEGRREMLLADIRAVFAERDNPDWLATAEIIKVLIEMEERPWCEWNHGKPITPQGLSALLSPFKIYSSRRRDGGGKQRGFACDAFADAWARYLLPDAQQGAFKPAHRPMASDGAALAEDANRPIHPERGRFENGGEPSDFAAPGRWTGSTVPVVEEELAL